MMMMRHQIGSLSVSKALGDKKLVKEEDEVKTIKEELLIHFYRRDETIH